MTTSNPAVKTVRHPVHLTATVSRCDVHDGVLGASATVTVDVASADQPIGVAVVVHWAEPIRSCTLGYALLPPDATTIAIRTSRAAPLAETDVYGFESMALYDSWLRSETAIDRSSSTAPPEAIWGTGVPPKTAGDGFNQPPAVVDA